MNHQRLTKRTLVGIVTLCAVVLILKTSILQHLIRALEWGVQPLHVIRLDVFSGKNDHGTQSPTDEGAAGAIELNNQILNENAELFSLRQQIIQLKQELNATSDWQRQTVHAEVVGRQDLLPAASIIINKGGRDGLQKGWLVTANGTLIGTVARTNTQTSLIKLLNHPESKIAARLLSQPALFGVVSGNADLAITLELIPQSLVVSDTDIVLTAPIGPFAETDIPIGPVTRGTGEKQGLFQTINITPLVNYRTIRFVTVIAPATLNP